MQRVYQIVARQFKFARKRRSVMEDNLTPQIRALFERASLTHEASLGMTGRDWEKYRFIKEHHGRERQFVRNTYVSEYKTRFEDARKALIDKAAQKQRSFLYRLAGRDIFERRSIDRQAHRLVQTAHHRDMVRLQAREDREIDGLLAKAERHENLRLKLGNDFTRAAERRQNPDRRETSETNVVRFRPRTRSRD
jgi:hypothetical protein